MRDVVYRSFCSVQVRPLVQSIASCLRPQALAPIAVAAAMGTTAFLAAPAVLAATFVVTNTNSSGAGSLDEALKNAFANDDPDRISFARGVEGTVSLPGSHSVEFSTLAIEGPGASKLTIEGDGQSSLFEVVFGELSLSGLSLRNAYGVVVVPQVGGPTGGIVKVSDCAISGMVESAFAGTYLSVDVADSTITGNGSGIHAYAADISNSLISQNARDGVTANGLKIVDSIISKNGRSGIVQQGQGDLQLQGSTAADNGSHGILLGEPTMAIEEGIFSRFTAEIHNSTVSGNGHAGIQGYTGATNNSPYAERPVGVYHSRLTVENTTIVSNRGGGIAVAVGENGTVAGDLSSSTIAYNSAERGGGVSVTVVPDMPKAGNIASDGLRIDHTIVAKNRARQAGKDLFTDLAGFNFDLNYSLVQSVDSAMTSSSEGAATNIVGQDPRLSRLQNFGGTTSVRGLESDSPAIDAGRAGTGQGEFDQRGTGYLRLAGERRDIGAVEQQTIETAPVLTRTLPDVDGNSTPYIATVVRSMNTGNATLQIRDAQNGRLITSVGLTGPKAVLDIKAVPDMNDNGRPEVAVLRDRPAKVELRDGFDGETVGTVAFSPKLLAHSLGVIPDINNNGNPELLVLGRRDGSNVVEIRDAASAELIRSINFSATAAPRNLVVLPQTGGNGPAVVAALFERSHPGLDDTLEVRDTGTGTLITDITLSGAREAVKVAVVDNVSGDSQPEVAVLQAGTTQVELFDVYSGVNVNTIAFDPFYAPLHVEAMPDMNGDGYSEVAVLGRSIKNDSLRVEVRDSQSGNLIRTLSFSALYRPDSFSVITDVSGNGIAELNHTGAKHTGVARSSVKDGGTGSQVNIINY